ncbi:hypothetical protein KY290_027400 [Solanum tuberosum]|uniref:Uncharacterized protein n=1 Tax=Solanum tuberosum TaxID=4113 RepID=A0ABQ7UG62_SOLTU|nr:hypothetical protein KY290_027400 [Solanum tuberosum]
MAKVDKVDHKVKEYLEDVEYEKWSRVHATVNRDRMMTTNISECINGCLVEARQLSILEFLKELEEDTLFVLRGNNDKNVANMHAYCSDYYKLDALAKTYEVPMVSMPDKED